MQNLHKILEQTSNDEIIEYKTCKYSGEKFPIFKKDLDLMEKISPVIGGEKYVYDIPEISPRIRQMMRLAFRNERKFYNIKINGKKLISTIHPEMRKNILKTEEFFDTDFTKINIEKVDDFDKNFAELLVKVPYIDRLVLNQEKSPYVNQELAPKNCHLIAGGMYNQDSMYSTFLANCSDMLDCYSCSEHSNNSYESIRVFNSSKIFFSQHIKDSYNVYFGREIINGKNIIFGFDITGGEYIYKDKQYSKEEWEEIFKDFKEKLKTNSGLQELKKEYKEFLQTKNLRGQLNTLSENVVGAMFMNSKNIFHGTTINDSEDVRYGNILIGVKDSIDVESYWLGEKLYNVSSGTDNQNTCGVTTHSWGTYNTFYSLYYEGGSNLFGCFGLKNKDNYILNKAYSKQDWEKEVVKIIEEKKKKGVWGEFFDMSLSPFPYNDTVAMEYFPPKEIVILDGDKILSRKTIDEKHGVGIMYILEKDKFISRAIFDLGGEKKIKCFYRTKEQEINIPTGLDIIFAKDLADSIDKIDDSILEKAVICEVSKRPFRISKKELEFYKKHNLSIPRIHYDIRHTNRLKFLPNREISVKTCKVCKQEKLTNYPEYKNICEECYKKKLKFYN